MQPDIQFVNPLKENVCIVGMGQEGKSNLLSWLLSINQNSYTLFNTVNALKFNPLRPEKQKIITPNYRQRVPIFLKICNEVWKQENQILAVDEIHNFSTKWQISEELGQIVNMGGNHSISIWFTTRRVSQVHNDLLSQCKHHFIFRTYLPQDLEWYGKVVPKDIILMSRDLPPYHFIYYKLGREPIIMKPVKDMTKGG